MRARRHRLLRLPLGVLLIVVAGLVGSVVGFWAATTVVGSDAAGSPPTLTSAPTGSAPAVTSFSDSSSSDVAPPSSATTLLAGVEVAGVDPEPPSGIALLVWTSGGLPAGFAAGVTALDGVTSSTVVRGDQVDLTTSWDATGASVDALTDGWRIPIDALAVDPAAYADALAAWARPTAEERLAIEALASGGAVLTETSAGLRRLGVGGRMELTGGSVEVVGVVRDIVGAGAEVLVSTEVGATLGVDTERYLLVTGDPGVEAAVAALTPTAVRLRSPGETPFARHGDAVLPQAVVKAAFGEFAYRPGTGRDVELDPAWVAEHIVTVELPVVGTTTCHEAVVPRLAAALDDIVARGLGHLVDPAGFAGCWVPRLIGPGLGMSRHAWGIAVDLNALDNPVGSLATKDPRLVEALAAQGFGWGGEWLAPDPMHFEITSPPA